MAKGVAFGAADQPHIVRAKGKTMEKLYAKHDSSWPR
jgi:hypothetical protein